MVEPRTSHPVVATRIHAISAGLVSVLRLRLALTVFAVGFVVMCCPAPIRADLVMSLGSMIGPTAGHGTFEVLLSNTNPTVDASYTVAAFSFELSVPVTSGVEFTGASTDTVGASYLFQGIGQGSIGPTFTLSLDTFPNTDFTGSDSTFPLLKDVVIDPGKSLGLGLIAYEIKPWTPTGQVQVTFVDIGTSLTTAVEAAVPFTTDVRGGIISITSTAVPEPSTFLVASISVVLIGAFGGMRRRFRQSK